MTSLFRSRIGSIGRGNFGSSCNASAVRVSRIATRSTTFTKTSAQYRKFATTTKPVAAATAPKATVSTAGSTPSSGASAAAAALNAINAASAASTASASAAVKKGAAGTLSAEDIRKKAGFIIDMDGVIYHGKKLLEGASALVQWLKAENKKFLFLTNSAERTPRELQEKLGRLGLQVSSDHFYSSALATALFLSRQCPNGSAYVIGEPGLTAALYDVGYSMNDTNPDYVVVGETRNYNYEKIETAVHLLRKGARLIGTNCDVADRMEDSFVPACGSLITPLALASGKTPYFIGKPNPLIMRLALAKLGVHRREAVIVGDRMDTDILAGIQSEISTVLVLSGVTAQTDVASYAYRPDLILPSVAHIVKDQPHTFYNA